MDPKFQKPRFDQYLAAVAALEAVASKRYGRSLLAVSVRWILDKGVPITIWGARKPSQLDPVDEISSWSMDGAGLSQVDSILAEHVKDPVGPEFMAPPTGLTD